jgi:3-oxoadipate enol-lactonase
MPFVTSQHGRDIYFERHGDGPTLLWLHGAGSNGATWWQQLPLFSRHATCVTVDIRCFGRSVAPTSEFALPLFVVDALAVLDHLEVPSATVVGQSLGGMIGLQLALRHPDRVDGFVACDSTLAVDHPGLLESLDRRLRTAAAMSIEQRSLGRGFLDRHPELAALYAQINHFNPSAHRIPPSEWRDTLARLNAPQALTPCASLGALRCPTLFLVGSDDPIVPAEAMHELAAKVEGSEVVVIDDAAHSAYFEQPAAFNRVVHDFVQRRVWSSRRAPPTA